MRYLVSILVFFLEALCHGVVTCDDDAFRANADGATLHFGTETVVVAPLFDLLLQVLVDIRTEFLDDHARMVLVSVPPSVRCLFQVIAGVPFPR